VTWEERVRALQAAIDLVKAPRDREVEERERAEVMEGLMEVMKGIKLQIDHFNDHLASIRRDPRRPPPGTRRSYT
jgi:hypothetical protein